MKWRVPYVLILVATVCSCDRGSSGSASVAPQWKEVGVVTFAKMGTGEIFFDLPEFKNGAGASERLIEEQVFSSKFAPTEPLRFIKLKLGVQFPDEIDSAMQLHPSEVAFRINRVSHSPERFTVHYFSGPFEVPEVIAEQLSYRDAMTATRERIEQKLGMIDEYRTWPPPSQIAADLPTKGEFANLVGPIIKQAEQGGAGRPATSPESNSEGGEKPQPESEGPSR